MEIEILLDSFNKTYNVGDNITGTINVTSNEKNLEFLQLNINFIGSYNIKNNKANPPTVSVIKFYSKKLKIEENGKMYYT